jgi:hypothetical protein
MSGKENFMQMKLGEAIRDVLGKAKEPLSPVQIRELVKSAYPYRCQTEAQRISIEKGNYQSFDHALLNPIYRIVTTSSDFARTNCLTKRRHCGKFPP